MITTFGTNTNPSSYEGASHTEDFDTFLRKENEIPVSFNICDVQCPYIEPCFSESGAVVDGYKNDKTDLLFELSFATDTVVLELWKCGETVATATLNNDTLGTYYTNTWFPDDKKIGFVADWNKIYNTHGSGKYYFKANRTLVNQTDSLQSWTYELKLFSEFGADNTVSFESVKEGQIFGGVDYSGFSWTSYQRFFGTFGDPQETQEQIHYQNQNRTDIQHRDKTTTIYMFETHLVPYEVINPFKKDTLLSNEMVVTSYNLLGHLPTYKPFEVAFNEYDNQEYFDKNSNGAFSMTFRDRSQTPIKTNF